MEFASTKTFQGLKEGIRPSGTHRCLLTVVGMGQEMPQNRLKKENETETFEIVGKSSTYVYGI